jgi:hypothetical protein
VDVFIVAAILVVAAGSVAGATVIARPRVERSAVRWADGEQSSVWPWLIGGTALLVCGGLGWYAFALPRAGRVPVPVYLPLLLLLPFVFWGTLGFFWNSKWFGYLVLGATSLIGALDAAWLVSKGGSRGIVLANMVGFGLAAALAGVGSVERSRKMIASGYLVLFTVVTVVAFPYYGTFELP